MTQSTGPLDPLFTTIVLASLAIGLPIVFLLLIRFLWYRDVNIGRSQELEKLIWQLHRIATAMEHEKGLSFPAVQPGAQDTAAWIQAAAEQASAAPGNLAPVAVAPAAAASSAANLAPEEPQRHGVNSMFGL